MSKKTPPEHLVYLQRRPFAFCCSTSPFPADEIEALMAYGNWLEALAHGEIEAVSREQEHFLQVDRDEAEPKSVCERAWVRLKGRREYEREQRIPPPASQPAETYDIVEWDADRCWW